MKLFADTASYEEIDYCFSNGVNDGITTNPKILELTGDLSVGFEVACKALLAKYHNVPVSVETDLDGMSASDLDSQKEKVKKILLKQARYLASFGKNTVIKIPICAGGLLAVKELTKEDIKTNVTACMNPYQTLKAAEAGATFVSYFANRALDSHIIDLAGYPLTELVDNPDWKSLTKANRDKYFDKAWARVLDQISFIALELESKYPDTELIIGSIRSPEDIYKMATTKPHVITIPTKIVKSIIEENKMSIEELKNHDRTHKAENVIMGDSLVHPMTTYTLDEFEKSADTYR